MRYITTLAKQLENQKTVRPMTSLPDSEGHLENRRAPVGILDASSLKGQLWLARDKSKGNWIYR